MSRRRPGHSTRRHGRHCGPAAPVLPRRRQDRHRRHKQRLIPGNGGQPPVADSALLDRHESGHDIYARRGILTYATLTLPVMVVEYFRSFWREIRWPNLRGLRHQYASDTQAQIAQLCKYQRLKWAGWSSWRHHWGRPRAYDAGHSATRRTERRDDHLQLPSRRQARSGLAELQTRNSLCPSRSRDLDDATSGRSGERQDGHHCSATVGPSHSSSSKAVFSALARISGVG
jgi:hypothetical protein